MYVLRFSLAASLLLIPLLAQGTRSNDLLPQDFPDPHWNITEYCTALGYPIEAHKIITIDGYILTYFRLQARGTKIRQGLKVVYWQHGLLDSSDLAVLNDEDKAPALMLANRGYDVWLGNSRGNWHSRANTHLSPEQKEFWDFTWQDMATKDLPAAFDYITNYTQQDKIDYIGHSQGTVIMHAALALRVESVVAHVRHVFSTGPIAYVGNVTSKTLRLVATQDWIFPVLDLRGYWDFLQPTQEMLNTESKICTTLPFVCRQVLRLSMDLMPGLDNTERFAYYTQHIPCGTSLRNMHHWQQLVKTDKFQLYDYGEAGNILNYGQSTPPQLDLAKIQEPIHLLAGDTDELADPVDVVRLWNQLKNSRGKTFKMYHMGHATFLIGKNMLYMKDIYNILES